MDGNGGECTGPYEAWQVVGAALAVAAVVGIAAWHRHGWVGAVIGTVTVTVLFIANAVTIEDPCNIGASFLPIGATMLFAGAAAGLGSVAAIVDGVRWNRSGRVSR